MQIKSGEVEKEITNGEVFPTHPLFPANFLMIEHKNQVTLLHRILRK